MLTLQYTVGHDYHRYREVTIFGKLTEQLLDHRAEVGLSLRQPWGTANGEFKFSQYLTDPSKYSLGSSAAPRSALFKGFSVNFFGEFSRTRDQIYLPRGQASTEEILLRQRQLLDRLPVLLQLRHQLFVRLDLQQHRQSALRRRRLISRLSWLALLVAAAAAKTIYHRASFADPRRKTESTR